MTMTKRKRWIAITAAVATIGAGALVVRAAWSASTTGNGEAVATIAQAITISPLGTGAATMYPGGPAATIYFTASNPNPYAVNFTTAVYSSPSSTSTASCPNSNISIASSAPTTVSVSLPANASNVPLSIPGVLQLSHSAPDGCQGVAFLVSVQLLGAEA
jgi:hypothetical protein